MLNGIISKNFLKKCKIFIRLVYVLIYTIVSITLELFIVPNFFNLMDFWIRKSFSNVNYSTAPRYRSLFARVKAKKKDYYRTVRHSLVYQQIRFILFGGGGGHLNRFKILFLNQPKICKVEGSHYVIFSTER